MWSGVVQLRPKPQNMDESAPSFTAIGPTSVEPPAILAKSGPDLVPIANERRIWADLLGALRAS